MELESSTLEEWLAELKPYQRVSVEQLVALHGEEEAAKTWLSANGPEKTVTFGGERNTEPFWDRFKEEFKKFVCGHESYAKYREQLEEQAPVESCGILWTTTVLTRSYSQLWMRRMYE